MLPVLAFFNDAALAEGGTPRVMHGESSVRMQSEDIRLTVGPTKTTAVCKFVFFNDGPTARIKMGFPDNGFGAADPEEEADPEALKRPPTTGPMTSFRSWVDGRAASMALERGAQAGEYWHTKTVTFRAHAQTRVRDVYTLPASAAIVSFKEGEGSASYAGYVVHTGASWRGKIGRSVVVFELPGLIRKTMPASSVTGSDRRQFTVDNFPAGTVVYKGMSKPTVAGKTLRFERRNWKPTSADDIELWFTFKRLGG